MSVLFSVSVLAAGACVAAPLTDEPVSELKLGSGKTLKLALARGYSADTVLVKHAQGAVTVKYEEFPKELRATVDSQRPGETSNANEKAPELVNVSYDFTQPPAVAPQTGEECELSGQVFVSTSDAGDVKLAGVKVSVYAKADYRAQSAWYHSQPWEASRAHCRNAEILAKAGDNAGAMKQFQAATEMAALGWMMVTPSEFSAVTDSEGRFSLKHRIAGAFFVVAHASRVVDGETENYRWALVSELIDAPKNVVLFNDNME